MMQFSTALGYSIRKMRVEKKMTLRDLSAKSHISLGYLSEIERGSKDASSQVIDCIARGFGVPNYELISRASQEMWFERELGDSQFAELTSADMENLFTPAL